MLSVFFQQFSAFIFISLIILAFIRILFLCLNIKGISVFSLSCIAGILLSKILLFNKFFNKRIFEWTSTQFIPLITAKLDAPHLLQSDFYLSAIQYSPFKTFVYPILVLEKIGIPWSGTLLVIKLALFFLTPIAAFLAMRAIYEVIKSADTSAVANGFIIVGISAFVSGGYVILQGVRTIPAGWSNILTNQMVAPMTVSAVFGFMYLFEIYRNKKTGKSFFAITFLILTTLTHPAMGIFFWIIRLLFDLNPVITLFKNRRLMFEFLVGLIFPIGLVLLSFPQEVKITALEFFEIYVKLRHPHHYLISRMSIGNILWYLIYMAIPFFIGKKYGFKAVQQLGLRIMSVYILVVLIQFLGSEVWPVKAIMKIGPVRLTLFTAIIIGLQYCHLFSYLANVWDEILRDFKYLYRRKIHYLLYLTISILLIIAIPVNVVLLSKDPLLNLPKDTQMVVNYLKEYTPENARIHVIHFDANAVRTFAQRAVLIDITFPFNEAAMVEYSRRIQFFNKGRQLTTKGLKFLKKKYAISYFVGNLNEFPQTEPVFLNGKWAVWNVEDIILSMVNNIK